MIKSRGGLIAVNPNPVHITRINGARDMFILSNGNVVKAYYDPNSEYVGYAPHTHSKDEKEQHGNEK